MLLKMLFLVVVALAVGPPVTAVGQRKLLAEIEKFNTKEIRGWGSIYDKTTPTQTHFVFYLHQYADGTDYGYLELEVLDYDTGKGSVSKCQLTSPGTYNGIVSTQFGNCETLWASDNPPQNPPNGCTQLSARLKGQPNQQNKCNNKNLYYFDSYSLEMVFTRYNERTKEIPASGTLDGVDCAFTAPVDGYIIDDVRVLRARTKKD
jgi:hypothetical protein